MTKSGTGYYEIELNLADMLQAGGLVDDYFYLQDLKQRKLYFNSDVDQCSIHEVVKHILQYNTEDAGLPVDARKPIILYIVSNGGEVDSGFELIDVIMASKTPVYTVNMGYQYSMGFLIGLAGHKRYATVSSKFLMHDGSSYVYNSGMKVQDQLKFQSRIDERIRSYVLARSKVSPEEYDSKVRVEWYLFADEAKEKGFTDYIIGVDCDIDEVL